MASETKQITSKIAEKSSADIQLKSGTYDIPDNNAKEWAWWNQGYGFKYQYRGSAHFVYIYLPISPENMTITSQFATNLIPTLTANYEEHSPNRYYDIKISGSTGMVPINTSFATSCNVNPNINLNPGGRQSMEEKFSALKNITGNMAALGFLNNATTEVTDSAKSLFSAKDTSKEYLTGFYINQSGYIAFHNLYRFFVQYKRDASGEAAFGQEKEKSYGQLNPLIFFNQKDNNEYSVSVRNFSLTRDKESPMLYFYSIEMRGYSLNSFNLEGNMRGSYLDYQQDIYGTTSDSYLSRARNVVGTAKRNTNTFKRSFGL